MSIASRRNCGRARPRRGALLAAAALLAGCHSTLLPGPTTEPASIRAPAPAAPIPQESELLRFVASAASGRSAVLFDARWGRVRVVAGGQYFSADGVVCRHFTVFPAGSDGETGAACREVEGWRLDPVMSKGTAILAR
jgi:hypothetical protein